MPGFSQNSKTNSTHSTQKINRSISLAGPRIGVTLLSDKFVNKIDDEYDLKLDPVTIQFGWQFEKRFFTTKSGLTAMSEWVVLVAGFEQEKFLPSLSWLIGMRSSGGFEIGAGPNLALSGSSLVVAAGINLSSEEINFPINLAYSTSQSGGRYSLLFGFNLRE